MARAPFNKTIDSAAWRRVLWRWQQAAERAERYDAGTLADLTARARLLRPKFDRIEAEADLRLNGLPGPNTPLTDLPPRTDWTWRPAPWCGTVRPAGRAGVASGTVLGDGVTLHHDCPLQEVTTRQVRGRHGWALAMDWAGFAGSYLSLVIALPEAGRAGLTPEHVLALQGRLQSERGGECFLRLNIRNGPNVAQMSLQQGFGDGSRRAEFDLAYTRFNLARVTEIWVDVIFEALPANRVVLEDIGVTRHRRAEL